MRQSRKFLYNAVAVGGSQVLVLVPSLVLVPYLIGTIGEQGYGTYVLIWALFVAVMQLQTSLQAGVIKHGAACIAEGRMQRLDAMVSTASVYSLVIALVSSGVIIAAGFAYNASNGSLQPVFLAVAVLAGATIIATPYVSVIQACQRYDVNAIALMVARFAGVGATVLWFKTIGPSVQAAITIMVGSYFVSRLVQAPIAHHLVHGLRNSPRRFEWASFRLIFSYGAAIALAAACLAANTAGVRWLMGALVSTSFVASLAIMLMPSVVLAGMLGTLTNIAMPAASGFHAQSNTRMLRELLIRGMRYMSVVAVAGTIAVSLLLKDLVTLWVGPGYAFVVPYALAVFLVNSFLQVTSVAQHIMKGMGKLRELLLIYLGSLAILPLALIVALHYGGLNPYLAVTIGLCAGYLVCGISQILVCAHALQASMRALLARSFGQPLGAGIVVLVLASGCSHFAGDATIGLHVLIAAAAISLYMLAMYFAVATAAERQQVREIAIDFKRIG